MSEAVPPRKPKQEQEHASDEITEVGENVLRLQLPIQMTGLGHVNMYTFVDERGIAVVDPGMPGPTSWRWVPKRLKQAGFKLSDVHTVLITHSHPDHFGGAGQLAREAGAEVVTHEEFRTWQTPHSHRDTSGDTTNSDGGDAGSDGDTHGHKHDQAPERPETTPWGTPPPWASANRDKDRKAMLKDLPLRRRLQIRMMGSKMAGSAMRRVMGPLDVTQRLADGDVIKLAGREWFAVHTPGHTPDHLCLHDPESGLVISGDHVLPTITPHISGLGPDADPLGSFFSSLDRMAALENVTKVLPAHGHPFPDIVERCEAIKRHHEERLEILREACLADGPMDVVEYSHHLFRPERWGGMAESETYAHLEHLALLGQAERGDDGGKLIYDIAPKA